MQDSNSNSPLRLSRRRFLANASLTALAMQAPPILALASRATVHTASGSLRGESVDGVRVFRGVPFAQPPIGPLRFRPALPVKPWSGERDATRFAASPIQWNESSAPGERPITHSEDCLYLNLWAPEGKGPFPVFVWIHGGGFISGHTSEPMYDGTEFARGGIVVVTIEYRLGVFGFLDVGMILGGEFNCAANNALRDLIMGLEWVQANISAFGGDPSRITIGGESAGAKLTDVLMGIPSAAPLFHQMISESGGAERIWSEVDARMATAAFGKLWVEQSKASNSDLKTAPSDLIIQAQHEFMEGYPYHFPLRPEVDGPLIPALPVWTISHGSTRGKRLLIGTNRDESALFIGPHPKTDPAAKDLGNLSVAKFQPVLERYKEVYPDMNDSQRRIRAVTAEEYWIPSMRVAEAHLQGGGSAFVYRLDFSESSGRLGGFAYHSLDVPWSGTIRMGDAANAAAEAALAKQIHLAWAAFVRGETPAAPGLPAWPQYSLAARPTMILDIESRVEQKPAEAELRLWDALL